MRRRRCIGDTYWPTEMYICLFSWRLTLSRLVFNHELRRTSRHSLDRGKYDYMVRFRMRTHLMVADCSLVNPCGGMIHQAALGVSDSDILLT